MSAQGDIDAWNERIDHCLGQAAVVLEEATKRYIVAALDTDDADAAATVAEAWRDLATTWNEREGWEIPEDEEAERAVRDTQSVASRQP